MNGGAKQSEATQLFGFFCKRVKKASVDAQLPEPNTRPAENAIVFPSV